ncbi:MAG TPA: SURF1 family protein [Candidatus Avipropionibacterium avicola]|uniref:SURF1-like protein n=1 Tax=Candidatus Avipropionibacterium avicola TaxID=2840701 RepID=A0A9D1GYU8_9ACTN|nr:SURF1 family protein [Candidatus Avipropionibacterium avicola]
MPPTANRRTANRRTALRWISLIVFALVLATLFIQLGQWQLRRLEERRANNAIVERAESAEVGEWTDYLGDQPPSAEDEWRRVRIEGTYLTDQQYVVRFRTNGDARGYEVITPLRTDDGRIVLIDRGFGAVPDGGQMPTSAPAAPTGPVSLVARIRVDERGGAGQVPQDGQIWAVNSGAIAEDLGTEVVPGWLQLDTSDVEQQGGLVPAALPALDEGPHFSYAMQWFSFTLIGVVGVVVFIRADLKDRRRQQARATLAR